MKLLGPLLKFIEVHKDMGPGLIESIYEACMIHELQSRGLLVESQQTVPVVYIISGIDH